MEALIIQSKEDTPGIQLNPEKGIFEINHRSLPEDAIAFFTPVFSWLEKYGEAPLAKSVFQFKLEYFNTSSAKQIYKLFCLLQDISKKGEIEINWYYQEEDKDMRSAGERYAKLIELPFKLISY